MKYNIGDIVKIRSDLVVDEIYGNLHMSDDMKEELCEKCVTVQEYTKDNNYIIKESCYIISDEMIDYKIDECKFKYKQPTVYDIDFTKLKHNDAIYITNKEEYDYCINELNNLGYVWQPFINLNNAIVYTNNNPILLIIKTNKIVSYMDVLEDKYNDYSELNILNIPKTTNNKNILNEINFNNLKENDAIICGNKENYDYVVDELYELGYKFYNVDKNYAYGKEFENIKQEEIEQINIDNNLKISKEFDFEKWKDEGLYVIVNNKEEFVDFVKCVWEYFKVPYSDRCKIDNLTSLNITNLIFYNSCESDLWFRIPKNEYSEFNDTINNKKDKCINWCDYMDNNYFNQRDESVDLENIKNNAYKAILKELNKEDELKFSHEEIKDKFFYIDKQVLINCKNIFKSIENETDLSKIDDALNIIDKMIDVKNKLLNDFDI